MKTILSVILSFLTMVGYGQGTPTYQFKTVKDMAIFPIPVISLRLSALITGGSAIGDGGGGVYFYESSSTAATNADKTVIKPEITTGRWIMSTVSSNQLATVQAGLVTTSNQVTTVDTAALGRDATTVGGLLTTSNRVETLNTANITTHATLTAGLVTTSNQVQTLNTATLAGLGTTSNRVTTVTTGLVTTSNRVETLNAAALSGQVTSNLTLNAAGDPLTNIVFHIIDTNGNVLFQVRGDGRAVFGAKTAATMAEGFEVMRTETLNTDDRFGIRSTYTLNNGGDTNHHYAATVGQIIIPAGDTNHYGPQEAGGYFYLKHYGSGLLDEGDVVWAISRLGSNSITANLNSFLDSIIVSDSAVATNVSHIHVVTAQKTGSGRIDVEEGLTIDSLIGGTSTKAINVKGNNPAHFGGAVDFSGNIIMNSGKQVLLDNGTASLPAIGFGALPDEGWVRITGRQWGFYASANVLVHTDDSTTWQEGRAAFFTNAVQMLSTLTITGAVTNNGTVTFNGSSLFIGDITKLNNVTSHFPTVQGAVNSLFQNDGSGNLTWSTALTPASVTASGNITAATANTSGALVVGKSGTPQSGMLAEVYSTGDARLHIWTDRVGGDSILKWENQVAAISAGVQATTGAWVLGTGGNLNTPFLSYFSGAQQWAMRGNLIVSNNLTALGVITGNGGGLTNVTDAVTQARLVTTSNRVEVIKSPTTTRGDISTRGASADQRLAVGTRLQDLSNDGVDPTWGANGIFGAFYYQRVSMYMASGIAGALTVIGDAANTTGALTASAPTSTDQVYLNLASTAVSNNSVNISGVPIVSFNRKIRLHAFIKLTETNAVRVWVGLFSTTVANIVATDSPGADFIGFRYSDAAESTWKACTKDGTTLTAADTAVNPITTAPVMLTLEWDPAGTAKFYINGVLKNTLTTNLPRTSAIGRLIIDDTTQEAVAKNFKFAWATIEEIR